MTMKNQIIAWCANYVLTQVIDRDDAVLFYLWSVVFELDRDEAMDTEENDQHIQNLIEEITDEMGEV